MEKKLWSVHYEQLSEECVGCQNDEGNQLGHKVSSYCEEMHSGVERECVLELWYERSVLEMPVTLNLRCSLFLEKKLIL